MSRELASAFRNGQAAECPLISIARQLKDEIRLHKLTGDHYIHVNAYQGGITTARIVREFVVKPK